MYYCLYFGLQLNLNQHLRAGIFLEAGMCSGLFSWSLFFSSPPKVQANLKYGSSFWDSIKLLSLKQSETPFLYPEDHHAILTFFKTEPKLTGSKPANFVLSNQMYPLLLLLISH